MLPSAGAKDGGDGGASVIDGDAHWNSRPNFFSTETFHQNVKDVLNTHGVAMRNAYFCVWQRLAHVKKHAAPHAAAAHRILCQVKKGSWDIVLHKITLIWCLQTDKIWY